MNNNVNPHSIIRLGIIVLLGAVDILLRPIWMRGLLKLDFY